MIAVKGESKRKEKGEGKGTNTEEEGGTVEEGRNDG